MFRRVSLFPVGVLAFAALSVAATAEPQSLDSAALAAALAGGATIELDTPLGTKVPMHFTDDGRVKGEAGAVAFALGAPADRGKWWIEKNKLCQKWTVWLDGDVQCLALRRDGQRVFWTRDDGKTGTATIVANTPSPPPAASERMAAGALPLPAAAQPPAPVTASVAAAPTPAAQVASAPKKTAQPKPPRQTVAAVAPPPAPGAAAPVTKAPAAAAPKAPALAAGKAAVPSSRPEPAAKQTLAARPQPAPAPPSIVAAVPPPLPSFRVTRVEDDDVLNVRTGPSEDHEAIGALAPSAQGVHITGTCERDWCPVRHRNVAGWVNRYYLTTDPSLSSAR